MNVNLNAQYSVLRTSANDVNRSVRMRSESVAQLASGPEAAVAAPADPKANSVLVLRNAGLRLRSVETGITNAISYLETQADVFRKMSTVGIRMSELASKMVDVTKDSNDLEADKLEFISLQAEFSSYRTAKFNGRNLFNFLDDDYDNGTVGTDPEDLAVRVNEEGNSSVRVTQSDFRNTSEPFSYLLGKITEATMPNADKTGIFGSEGSTVEELVDEAQFGQTGFRFVVEGLARRLASNQAEQSQLRLNLEKVREKILGTDMAVSRVTDVDVASELSVLAKTDMQLRGSIAARTQSNVFADSALKLLSNGDFSSPLIREARLSAPWTKVMLG